MNKAKAFFFRFSFLLLLVCFSLPACAQEPVPSEPEIVVPNEDPEEDDLQPVPITEIDSLGELPVEVADTVLSPVPGTSAFFSAVLPGLGQAYNNSHWKIPLIYIGAAAIVFTVNDRNRKYSTSIRNLNLIQFNPAITEVEGRDQAYWERNSSNFRRSRDYAIIIGGVLYVLNIVEAYVDAHLQDFNVNDDLAIHYKPALIAGPGGSFGAGIALTLNIK